MVSALADQLWLAGISRDRAISMGGNKAVQKMAMDAPGADNKSVVGRR